MKAEQAKNRDAWWVQTGSFTNKNWADEARNQLFAKGINSIIENQTVDGKTWYRVRVGPYTSSNEADYWKSLISTINGFEAAQVWKNKIAL
jgi:DedD protein